MDSAHGSRFDLHGRTALVTGAARGLGRSIALALAEAGADVALGLRDASAGDGGLADEIRALGRRALPLQMDVTRPDEISAAVRETVAELGSLDLLVNNAGGGAGLVPAEEVAIEAFDRTLEVNLRGTFLACRAAFEPMRERGFGRIVNVSSQAAVVALPGEAAYCAAKAAVTHLTRCFAVEWGRHGVNVNAVAPTFIRTPGTEPALSDAGFRAEVEERIAALAPDRRARRGRRRRRLSLLSGRLADHRRDARDRRWLDDPLTRRGRLRPATAGTRAPPARGGGPTPTVAARAWSGCSRCASRPRRR